MSPSIRELRRLRGPHRRAARHRRSSPRHDLAAATSLSSRVLRAASSARVRAESAQSWRHFFHRGVDDWHWLIVGGGSVVATFASMLFASALLFFGPDPARPDSLSALITQPGIERGRLLIEATPVGDDKDSMLMELDTGNQRADGNAVMPAMLGFPTERDLVECVESGRRAAGPRWSSSRRCPRSSVATPSRCSMTSAASGWANPASGRRTAHRPSRPPRDEHGRQRESYGIAAAYRVTACARHVLQLIRRANDDRAPRPPRRARSRIARPGSPPGHPPDRPPARGRRRPSTRASESDSARRARARRRASSLPWRATSVVIDRRRVVHVDRIALAIAGQRAVGGIGRTVGRRRRARCTGRRRPTSCPTRRSGRSARSQIAPGGSPSRRYCSV